MSGPAKDIIIEPEYLDISLQSGVEYVHPVRLGATAILYAIGGSGTVAGTGVENRTLVLFGPGDELAVTGGSAGFRFLLMTGHPLKEPIAWRGPIVMNTEEELYAAFREFEDGTFVK